MSDTPRTDQIEELAYWFQDETTPVCESRFVRSLERELNTANERIKRLEREIEVLRLYGNKDCTAMADEILARNAKI